MRSGGEGELILLRSEATGSLLQATLSMPDDLVTDTLFIKNVS